MKYPQFAGAACIFLVTFACAVAYGWEAGDLIWASWISTLCVGGAVFLVSLASVFQLKGPIKGARTGCAKQILLLFLMLWVVYLVFLPEILHGLFPLSNQGYSLVVVIRTSLQLYWPFLLISLICELVGMGSYWWRAGRMNEGGNYTVFLIWRAFAPLPRMLVFAYVVHCLCVAGLSGSGLYPALAFYFFPWGAVPWGDLFGPNLVRRRSSDPDRMAFRWGGGVFSVVGWALLLAGLFLVIMSVWTAQSDRTTFYFRGGWLAAIGNLLFNLYVAMFFYALPFGAVGAVLAFVRFELILDRRAGIYSSRDRVLARQRSEKGKLDAKTITAVRITREEDEDVWQLEAGPGVGGLSLTGQGPAEVHLVRCGEDFKVETPFTSLQKAHDLAEELATFYGVPLVAGAPSTEGSSESGAETNRT